MTSGLCYLTLFLTSLTFPLLSSDDFLGLSLTFLLYSTFGLFLAAFTEAFLPETKDKDKDEIEKVFSGKPEEW